MEPKVGSGRTALSNRMRANSEAAPWIIVEVANLEAELAAAYLELRKIRPAVKAIFDRAVWDRAAMENEIVRG